MAADRGDSSDELAHKIVAGGLFAATGGAGEPTATRARQGAGAFSATGLGSDPSATAGENGSDTRPLESDQARLRDELTRAAGDPRRTFGRFLLLAELGHGGMGIVHRAWDTRLRRVVALKMILEAGLRGKAAIQRIQREAEAVARLRHPNIVSVHELGEVGGKHYLALEFIDGETLERKLRPDRAQAAEAPTEPVPGRAVRANPATGAMRRIPLNKAVEALRDVARAIHYAHAHGVVHRDLKPDNIIIDRNGRAYVLDFGIAQVLDHETKITKEGSQVGTLVYMSPEQADPKRGRAGERSDIYSLGATLYDVLTGRPPFIAENAAVVYASLLSDDPLPPVSNPLSVRADEA
ncbi:serine/threonine protein kinase [bacterium]|nr:serine/threonine protein kinase [bacterium]